MGKVKIEIYRYCYITVDILTKVLQKCSLSSPLQNIWILSKLLNLIGCHGNRKDKWEKWKLAFIAISLQIFWQRFYRDVPQVVLYQTYEFCPNCWIWLVAMAAKGINWQKKYSKVISLEAIRGMKLKLCRNVHDISLYKNFVFYCTCLCAFLAMAT